VRLQAHPDARRRLRPGSKGAAGGAPRALLRLGLVPPEHGGRVRRDRGVAPRAGVPAFARGRSKPHRAADPRGRRRPRRRREARRLLGDIDQRQGRTSEAKARLTEAQRLASLSEPSSLQVKVPFVFATFVGDYESRHDDAIESLRTAIATAEKMDDKALVAEGHLRIAALLHSRDLAAAEPE